VNLYDSVYSTFINDHTVFLYFKTVATGGTVQPLSLKITLWIHYRLNGTSVKMIQQVRLDTSSST